MAKMSIDELKETIAEIVSEAKKKTKKSALAKKRGRQIEAYGITDDAFDFSAPLGAYNLYRQQGAVNWGPMTSDGTHIDTSAGTMKEGEEKALRSLVREVIENGVVPEDSAWAPMMERRQPTEFDSVWSEAKHWFQREVWEAAEKESKKFPKEFPAKGAQGFEKQKRVMHEPVKGRKKI